MNQEELRKRKERAERETLVISQMEEGFRVYNPASPTNSYVVSGSPQTPKCTCPDFQLHQGDPQWRCKHILAVLNQVGKKREKPEEKDSYDGKERETIQNEGRPPEKKRSRAQRNGTSQMLIKRSISPDGHIDSLSVEFTCTVNMASTEEIKAQAEKTLKLQSEIVEGFLKGNGKENGKREAKGETSDRYVPAQMLDIGGMPGKWGRRLFINVQVNGQVSRLFGGQSQLAEYIVDAGFAHLVGRITEGFELNLPCRVITKPSQDGRFLNIKRVLPIEPLNPKRRVGR